MNQQGEQSEQNDLESVSGSHQQEQIPLQRLISVPENEDRQRIKGIFDNLDTDNDGHLDLAELEVLIAKGVGQDIPQSMAENIVVTSDENRDGRLDFEEFYKLSVKNRSLLSSYIHNYCKMIVPQREQIQDDEIEGAYERQMTFCPPPLTMIIFSMIEIIIFMIDVIYLSDDPKQSQHIGESTEGPAATLFTFDPNRKYEVWRFVSYMFVHVGTKHLISNLVFQIFLGIPLELVHHWWRVALVYLAGVVAGSMGTSLSSPTSFLSGASGGVYALITAHIATIIMNFSEMKYAIVQIFFFLIFCFTDLVTSIHRHLNVKHDNIGYVAHLSGAIAGLLVGIGMLRNLKERRCERILWWIAVTFYCALMIAGIMFQIFKPDFFNTEDQYYMES